MANSDNNHSGNDDLNSLKKAHYLKSEKIPNKESKQIHKMSLRWDNFEQRYRLSSAKYKEQKKKII